MKHNSDRCAKHIQIVLSTIHKKRLGQKAKYYLSLEMGIVLFVQVVLNMTACSEISIVPHSSTLPNTHLLPLLTNLQSCDTMLHNHVIQYWQFQSTYHSNPRRLYNKFKCFIKRCHNWASFIILLHQVSDVTIWSIVPGLVVAHTFPNNWLLFRFNYFLLGLSS